MELTRRNVFITFTILCAAASVVVGFQYIGSIAYRMTENWMMNQGAGVSRWLSWLFHSPWTETLVQYGMLIGIAYIPAYLILWRLPRDHRKQGKLSGRDFLLCLAACMGVGYGLNLVGTCLNFLIGLLTSKSVFDMNPVADMTLDMTPSMILYTCIVGPFMEELMFRGLLLKRARLFGDRTAVIFTALMFGLMHGNLAQFLYATAIGLILGYVAVKTNGIRYTVIMHMIVNSYSTALAVGETMVMDMGSEILEMLYVLGMLATMLFLIVGSVVILVQYAGRWYRELSFHNGNPSPYRKYVYLNPGFLVYFGICMVDFLYYLL